MISNEMDPLVVNSGAAALDLIARQSSTLDMILNDRPLAFIIMPSNGMA